MCVPVDDVSTIACKTQPVSLSAVTPHAVNMMTGMPELVSAVSRELRGKDVASPWIVQISYREATVSDHHRYGIFAQGRGEKAPLAKLSSNAQVDGIAGKFVLSWTETDGELRRKLRVNFEDFDSAYNVLIQKIQSQMDEWCTLYIAVIESQVLRHPPEILSSHKITLKTEQKTGYVDEPTGLLLYGWVDAFPFSKDEKAIDVVSEAMKEAVKEAVKLAVKIANSASMIIYEC